MIDGRAAKAEEIYERLFASIPEGVREKCGVLLWVSRGGQSLSAFEPQLCKEWWPRKLFRWDSVDARVASTPFRTWFSWVAADAALGQQPTDGTNASVLDPASGAPAMMQALYLNGTERASPIAWVRWKNNEAHGRTPNKPWTRIVGGAYVQDPELLGLAEQRLESSPEFDRQFGCIAMFFPRFNGAPECFSSNNAWISDDNWTCILERARALIGIATDFEGTPLLRPLANIPIHFGTIVGSSASMKPVLELIKQAARSDVTVLINGETGTGKELVAGAIHSQSSRGHKQPLTINCAALPETTIESELFGHTKHAFTDAKHAREGYFVAYSDSTLFLDEIGHLSPRLQPKLLRVIQEKEILPMGSNTPVHVHTRLIAASKRDLRELCVEGKFLEELMYRLDVFPIHVPPLRDRKDDIPYLAQYFLQRMAQRYGQEPKSFEPAAVELLRARNWPGNVRQLESAIERAILRAPADVLTADLFDGGDGSLTDSRQYTLPSPSTRPAAMGASVASSWPLKRLFAEMKVAGEDDKSIILSRMLALKEQHGTHKSAAKVAGVGIDLWNRKLKEFGYYPRATKREEDAGNPEQFQN